MNYTSRANSNLSLNFNLTKENVISNQSSTFSSVHPPPPDEGYFLLLQGSPLVLLNGQDMTLL